MVLVFYISGHGLGHASRDLEVIKAIRQLRPESRVVVRTSASPWFFEASRVAGIELQPAQVDTGVVQIDSIRLDEEATARKAREFYATFDARVGSEAVLLGKLGAAVVLGDMPPLAFAAAKRARVPSVAV